MQALKAIKRHWPRLYVSLLADHSERRERASVGDGKITAPEKLREIYVWLRSPDTYRARRNHEPSASKGPSSYLSRLDGFQGARDPQKVFGKAGVAIAPWRVVASRRVEVSAIADQKGKTIPSRARARTITMTPLGKAIKGEQRTDEVGASAMWRPCFASRLASGGREKKARRSGEAFINTARSNKIASFLALGFRTL